MTAPAQAVVRPGLILDGEAALVWPSLGLLAVADLHWGYAASHQRRHRLLPSWGDEDIGARLQRLITRHRPRILVVLGDSLHTSAGQTAAEAFLNRLPPDLEVVLLSGNHDRRWARADRRDWTFAHLCFHHGDQERPTSPDTTEVVGHWHPAFRWSDGAGGTLKVPALVEGPRRLILPAFSPWAGGVDWSDRLESGERLWVCTPSRVFPLPPRDELRPDRRRRSVPAPPPLSPSSPPSP